MATQATPRTAGSPALLAVVAGLAAAAAWALAPTASAFGATYQDVAEDVGVRFQHAGGGADPWFYEITGSGACFGDFDGDGYEDLFLANERYHDADDNGRWFPTNRLFKSNGDGTFSDVSIGSGADRNGWFHGCAVGDLDQDGDLDLIVVGYGESLYLENVAAFVFENATAEAGLSIEGKCGILHPCWATGVSLADTNLDGCLDVYVVDYVEYTDLIDEGNAPGLYDGQKNLYFESRCDGTFEDRTTASNLDDDPGPKHSKSFQPVWTDFNGDGFPDVYVTADSVPNSLFRNNGDGTFTDVAAALEIDDPRAGMGLEVDDVDGDGDFEFYMTHFEREHNGFYYPENGQYVDKGGAFGLSTDFWFVGWGATFADLDLNGGKEIVVVNGDTIPGSRESRLAWHLRPDGTWADVSGELGPGFAQETVGRGLTKCDYDFDGDVDFVVVNNDNETANVLRASGVSGTWLEVQLRDPGLNGRAVGAQVKVTLPSGKTALSTLQAGSGYLGQHCMNLHFGLDNATSADVEVLWPNGERTRVEDVPADRVARITRGTPGFVDDVLSPVSSAAVRGAFRSGWYSERPTVELTSKDRGIPVGKGVDRIEYRIDGGDWITYAGPFTVDEGRRTVLYRAVDAVGNTEPVQALALNVDLNPPGTTASVEGNLGDDGWHVTEPIVTLAATDALSGVERTAWRDGDGAEEDYAAPFRLGEGVHPLSYRSTDVAGNSEAGKALLLRVDVTAPATELDLGGAWLYHGRTLYFSGETVLTLTATDGTSGVASTEYRLDAAPWTRYLGPFSPTGADGRHTLEYRSKDAAGNLESVTRWAFVLDNGAPPSLEILSPKPNSVSLAARTFVPSNRTAVLGGPLEQATGAPYVTVLAGPVPVRVLAGPDVSGLDHVRVRVDGLLRAEGTESLFTWTWDTSAERLGWHLLEVEAADGLGNVARSSMWVEVVPAGAQGVSATLSDGVARP